MLRKSFCLFALLIVGVALTPKHAQAQTTYTESVLYSFCSVATCADGEEPPADVIQGADGNFYGTTQYGPTEGGGGTIFKVTPSGEFDLLHAFCSLTNCLDGATPASLVQGSDGNFYGTTESGGTAGVGTVFKITPAGALTTLYNFCAGDCTQGYFPQGGLIQGSDGNFYGTTSNGGPGFGTAYKISPSGTFTLLYSFCSQADCADGRMPYIAKLLQGTDGNFYGTTLQGGEHTYGTIFQLTPSSTLTTIYTFCSTTNIDGDCTGLTVPYGTLVETPDGSFNGTTLNGIYNVTTTGTFTELAALNYNYAGLTLGADGNYYGTTLDIGNFSGCSPTCGSLFQMTPSGTLTTVYKFCTLTDCADGASPSDAAVIQGSDGAFYGTTYYGGASDPADCNDSGCGTLYRVAASPALAAPVQVTLSESSVAVDSPVTLNWKVLNATSGTMQLCYAFTQAGGGTWTGLQTATVTSGSESGSATITPTEPGTYTYALTCGGVESGLATLTVNGTAGSMSLFTNSPVYRGVSAAVNAVVYGDNGGPIPTGSVSFSIGSTNLGSVSLSGGAAGISLETSSLTVGSYTIAASYSGDSHYSPATTTSALVVQSYTTFNQLTINSSPVAQGQKVTLLSIVRRNTGLSSPTGTVTFTSGTETLGTATLSAGVATLSLTAPTSVPPGAYPVKASYAGDSADAASTSGTLSLVLQANTTTTLSSNLATVPYGGSYTLTGKVSRVSTTGTATGTVLFYYSGSTLAGAAVLSGGVATLTLQNNGTIPSGVNNFTSVYEGDTYDISSDSSATTVTLSPAGDTTSTSLTLTPSTVAQGQALSLKSTVLRTSASGTPTGTVTFYSGTTEIAAVALSGGVASSSLAMPTTVAPGTYPVTAQYSGDASDNASTSAADNVTVIAATKTTLTISPNPAGQDQIVSLTGTVKETYGTAVPTGTVTFSAGGTAVGSGMLNNGTVTINLSDFGIAAGKYTVTATYSGNTSNAASSATVNLTVQ